MTTYILEEGNLGVKRKEKGVGSRRSLLDEVSTGISLRPRGQSCMILCYSCVSSGKD